MVPSFGQSASSDGARGLLIKDIGELVTQQTGTIPAQSTLPAQLGRMSLSGREVDPLFLRRGQRFVDVAGSLFPASALDGRSVVASDLFREGAAAILVRHRNQRLLTLYRRTQLDDGDSGLTVTLRQPGMNRYAIGARVRLTTEQGRLTRWVSAGEGFLSAPPPEVFIGIPAAATGVGRAPVKRVPEELEVRWPDGGIDRFAVPAPMPVVWQIQRPAEVGSVRE